jgi:DNA repair photolyase
MIISASRRTDIPAFFVDRFMEDLEIGRTEIVNPFNPKQTKVVDLTPEAVDAIVFWTRYPQPLLKYLDKISQAGYDFIFLYTVTGYPKILEPNVPEIVKTIDCFKRLSDMIGPAKVIWRYDPIVISRITDEAFHLENFEKLSHMLSGYTPKVIISFLDFYKKLGPRFRRLENEYNIVVDNIMQVPKEAIGLARQIREIAESHNLDIQTCAEDEFLAESGIKPGACIDSLYLSEIFKKPFPSKKDCHQRASCLCNESIDIGRYSTCKFKCVYCYAIR